MHGPGSISLRSAPATASRARDRAPKRRIGVLTLHRCINYGSFWQAKCLVEGLRARGHDAVLLDHRDRRIDLAEWRCALEPHLPARGPAEDRKRHAAKVRAFARALQHLPLSAPFEARRQGLLCGYEYVLVGSDEVWNPSHPWYGGSGLFRGEGIAGPRLVAHAASAGNHGGALDGWGEPLGRFATIAVRDRKTRELVRQVSGRTAPLVLDPVLQFPPRMPPPLLRSPFALVYGHDFPDWVGEAARAWAKRQGLRLLSVGYRADFADEQWLEAGPWGFASAVAGASAMITTMFHGAVFALNRQLPFVAVPSAYRADKLSDLVDLVGATPNLASVAEEIAPALDRGFDPGISRTIAALRDSSDAVLDKALG